MNIIKYLPMPNNWINPLLHYTVSWDVDFLRSALKLRFSGSGVGTGFL